MSERDIKGLEIELNQAIIKNKPVVVAGGETRTGRRLLMGNMPKSRPNQVWKIIASQKRRETNKEERQDARNMVGQAVADTWRR